MITILFNGNQIYIYSREVKATEKKNPKKKKTFASEVFSWADALLSAVIFVLLINMFLIQIYSIPSESMFPVFFVKDRPVVDKITRGPSIPFTRFRIPAIQKIHRGDIVTFRNPKYSTTVESELKHLFSQFLYMITFTAVNIDRYDEEGNEKADPLVKRVVAVQGEQIQIINDKIYIRNNLDEEFQLLEEDIHSETDLYKLDQNSLSKLKYLPINSELRAIFTSWDNEISHLDRATVTKKILENAKHAEVIRTRLLSGDLKLVQNNLKGLYDRINDNELSTNKGYYPFQKIENLKEDNVHFLYNLDDNQLWKKGWEFLQSYSEQNNRGTFFELASNTDLRFKLLISNWMVNNLEYMNALSDNNETNIKAIEEKLRGNEKLLGQFLNYILRYYDFRNLPPFPQNKLIEKNNYFLMGDNRYNSLDLRHGLHSKDRFFIEDENNTFVYKSYLNPMTINESGIEGFVLFRLFPINRFGRP
jgi:signal peptidase I